MITVNDTGPVGDGNQQWVFLTIDNVDGSLNVQTTRVAPLSLSGAALQSHVDAREEEYKAEIMMDMYPNADYSSASSGITTFQLMTNWIAEGRTNPPVIENGIEIKPAETITKVAPTYQHEFVNFAKRMQLDRGKITKAVVDDMMGSLTTDQKLNVLMSIIGSSVLEGSSGSYTFNDTTKAFDGPV